MFRSGIIGPVVSDNTLVLNLQCSGKALKQYNNIRNPQAFDAWKPLLLFRLDRDRNLHIGRPTSLEELCREKREEICIITQLLWRNATNAAGYIHFKFEPILLEILIRGRGIRWSIVEI